MKQIRFSIRSSFVLMIAGLVFFTLPAQAAPTGIILGTVRDATGAVIAGVEVKVLNTATNFSRTALTDSLGDYTLTSLPLGNYTITATLQGFKQSVIPNIVLQVDQQARVDVSLQVGEISTKVEVTGTQSLLVTDTSAVGQVIENKKIVDLPLNGRNFTQLAALTPGALTSQVTGAVGEVHGFTTVQVGGGQSSKTEFLLDGVSNQEQLFDGVQFVPSVDAIQEFKVQSNAFSAEYGRGTALINATIRAGTNDFHGTAFEFLRNDHLDARNFFDQSKGILKQNQFGGTLGGPVVKDRTFFFGNYDATRLRRGLTRNTLVPTAAFQQGDFSALPAPIRDPLTGTIFPGNRIPADRFNSANKYLLQFIPLPNNPTGTLQYLANRSLRVDQVNGRVDHRFSDSDSVFVRYSLTDQTEISPGSLPTSGTTDRDTRTQNVALSETHIFNPQMLNEVRIGYGRLFNANFPQGLGTNYTVQAGIKGFDQTSVNFPGFPNIGVTGFGTLINSLAFAPIVNPTNTWHLVDNFTWIKGRHTAKFGIDFRRFHLSSTNSAFSRGSFSYGGGYSGNGFADYLLGYPSSGIRDFPRNHFGLTDNQYHFYGQDDIKLTPKLTLNLGLRYELNMVPTADQAQAANFDLRTGKWIVSTLDDGSINLTTQQVSSLVYPLYKDRIVTAQQANVPNNLQEIGRKQFAPRVGLAYRPFDNNRTVLRGGYGIFYVLQRGNPAVSYPIINLPFILDEFKNNTTPTPTLNTVNFFDAPFGFGGPLLSSFEQKLRPPYSQQWNLSIQRELISNLSLDLAYVGSKGTRLEQALPTNFCPPGAGNCQERRPFTDLSGGTLYANSGSSTYHALQAKLEKRYSQGLSLLGSYTWSKLIDDSNVNSGGTGPADPRNLRLERALAQYDATQRLVTSFAYELPFGRGKRFGGGMSGAANKVFGGWQLGGIVQYQSGFPFTPVLGSPDPANVAFAYARRPDRTGSGQIDDWTVDRYFDISAFKPQAPFTIGNSGRNILRGPGVSNWDLSILKNTYFTEKFYCQFRLELFNVWNTAQFFNPETNVDPGSNGGRILSARDPRIIQGAIKFYF